MIIICFILSTTLLFGNMSEPTLYYSENPINIQKTIEIKQNKTNKIEELKKEKEEIEKRIEEIEKKVNELKQKNEELKNKLTSGSQR